MGGPAARHRRWLLVAAGCCRSPSGSRSGRACHHGPRAVYGASGCLEGHKLAFVYGYARLRLDRDYRPCLTSPSGSPWRGQPTFTSEGIAGRTGRRSPARTSLLVEQRRQRRRARRAGRRPRPVDAMPWVTFLDPWIGPLPLVPAQQPLPSRPGRRVSDDHLQAGALLKQFHRAFNNPSAGKLARRGRRNWAALQQERFDVPMITPISPRFSPGGPRGAAGQVFVAERNAYFHRVTSGASSFPIDRLLMILVERAVIPRRRPPASRTPGAVSAVRPGAVPPQEQRIAGYCVFSGTQASLHLWPSTEPHHTEPVLRKLFLDRRFCRRLLGNNREEIPHPLLRPRPRQQNTVLSPTGRRALDGYARFDLAGDGCSTRWASPRATGAASACGRTASASTSSWRRPGTRASTPTCWSS